MANRIGSAATQVSLSQSGFGAAALAGGFGVDCPEIIIDCLTILLGRNVAPALLQVLFQLGDKDVPIAPFRFALLPIRWRRSDGAGLVGAIVGIGECFWILG